MKGRIRLTFESAWNRPETVQEIPGVTALFWYPRICSMLITYDPVALSEFQLLQQVCARYAAQTMPKMIHVRHEEEKGFSLTPAAVMALMSIAADGIVNALTLPVGTFTKWLSILTTLTAVTEHGWEELNQRGSFYPEVMSVVYLLNSLTSGKTLQASALAWGLTFGRHLLPRDPRESAWVVYRDGDQVTLYQVNLPSSQAYAGSLLRSGLDAIARKAS